MRIGPAFVAESAFALALVPAFAFRRAFTGGRRRLVQQRDRLAHAHGFAVLLEDLADDAVGRRGQLQRGLVGFQLDDVLVGIGRGRLRA